MKAQETLINLGVSGLNWVDYSFLFVVLLSTIISLIRGFLRESISLITWVAAFWVAIKCNSWLSVRLIDVIPQDTFRHLASIVILLVIVLIVGMLVATMADKLIKKGKLSSLDRLLGGVFGVARGGLIISLLLFFGHVLVLNETVWWKESKMIKHFQEPVKWLQKNIPHQVEHISMLVFLDKNKI